MTEYNPFKALKEEMDNLVIGHEDVKTSLLLDDISRAPGDSLNILLRILNERKFGEERIPLLTAIGTSNPTVDEYYNEPLDPANLDRFVLQTKARGLSYGKKWNEAKEGSRVSSNRPLADGGH